MPTELLPTRKRSSAQFPREPLSRSFWLAAGFHVVVVGGLFGWSLIHWRSQHHFGTNSVAAGSIQASMVSALPLPPKAPVVEKAVLASEKPSVAPTPAAAPPSPPAAAPEKPRVEPPPRRDAIPITTPAGTKVPKSNKVEPTPKPAPVTPKPEPRPETPTRRPEPTPPTPKATTGERSGTQIPQSTTELRTGISSFISEERSFGDRYAYYIRVISQKVNQSRAAQPADPPDAKGKRTVIRFTIDRDGTPTDAEVQTQSGSVALDRSALRAIQHIDTFGPLPAGDHLTVDFGFTDH